VGIVLGLTLLMCVFVEAQATPVEVCPGTGIQPRPATFEPGGIILTTFDREAIWVYNIEQDTRYPLPDTVPCTRNCDVSPDSRWIVRMNEDFNYIKMRIDGTERTPVAGSAAEVTWWNLDTLLVWTPDLRAYLTPHTETADPTQQRYLNVDGVVSVQPGGTYALSVQQTPDGTFQRQIEDLQLREVVGIAGIAPLALGPDQPYFNDAAWSPNGEWLAYVSPMSQGDEVGSELFGVSLQDLQPTQWTNFSESLGSVRINGHAVGDLSWSPDSTQVAFWVAPLTGEGETDASEANIYIYDVQQGQLNSYCGFSTIEHTPTPPRLIWSPDGTHLAFGGNVPNDDKGYLLLALDVSDGSIVELSDGIYPALGNADVIAWGNR